MTPSPRGGSDSIILIRPECWWSWLLLNEFFTAAESYRPRVHIFLAGFHPSKWWVPCVWCFHIPSHSSKYIAPTRDSEILSFPTTNHAKAKLHDFVKSNDVNSIVSSMCLFVVAIVTYASAENGMSPIFPHLVAFYKQILQFPCSTNCHRLS